MSVGVAVASYQNLIYQYDGKVNITGINDQANGITHSYTYDSLDRLLTANGAGNNPYSQSYGYDRIGNITSRSDVGSYDYGDYSSKPHAVRAVRAAGIINFQYDENGNMIQRSVAGGVTLSIRYNFDNKPVLIKKNNVDYIAFTYDGNGQRVRKQNLWTGRGTIYFGKKGTLFLGELTDIFRFQDDFPKGTHEPLPMWSPQENEPPPLPDSPSAPPLLDKTNGAPTHRPLKNLPGKALPGGTRGPSYPLRS
jgi:YD repeat-containing protein